MEWKDGWTGKVTLGGFSALYILSATKKALNKINVVLTGAGGQTPNRQSGALREVRTSGRKRAESKFSWAAIAAQTKALYQQLLVVNQRQ
jgi:hypothetical protein